MRMCAEAPTACVRSYKCSVTLRKEHLDKPCRPQKEVVLLNGGAALCTLSSLCCVPLFALSSLCCAPLCALSFLCCAPLVVQPLPGAYGLARHRDGRWEWAVAPGVSPSARYQHAAVFVNLRLHVSGGALGGGRMVEDSSSIAGTQPVQYL